MSISLKSPVNRLGGKFFLSSWIVEKMPEHTCYVEPFAGAAHTLFAKTPSPVEILNDIDSHLINFFKVIQDTEKRQRLVETLECMPYSRSLWQEVRDDVLAVNTSLKSDRAKSQKQQLIECRLRECPEMSDRQIARELGVDHKTVGATRKELTRRGEFPTSNTLIDTLGRKQRRNRSCTDIQKAANWFYLNRSTFAGDMLRGGFAAPSVTGRNTAQSFRNAIDSLDTVAQRLRNVCIESLGYAECIKKYDSENTLFYIDSPYLGTEHYYGDAFSLDDHYRLSDILHEVKGKVMVTHYQNGVYDELYPNWQRYEYESFKGSHKSDANEEKPKTTEALYCNFRQPFKTRSLFNELSV